MCDAPHPWTSIGASAQVAPQRCPIPTGVIVCGGFNGSIMFCLQVLVDGDVLVNEREGAVEGVGDLVGRHPIEPIMSDTVILTKVLIDGFEAVIGFARDLVGRFAIEIAFATDDALVRQTGTDIVDGGAARDHLSGLLFVVRQGVTDLLRGPAEQFGEIAQREQRFLLEGWVTEANGFGLKALLGRLALDAGEDVVGRAGHPR